MLRSFRSASSSGPSSLSDVTSTVPTALASFRLPAISQKELRHKAQPISFRRQSPCILFSSPEGLARGESTRGQEKDRLGIKSLLGRSHPGDHWACQHLGPVSVPCACATFDQLFSAPGPLSSLTELEWDFFLGFLPACLFLNFFLFSFFNVVDFHSFSQHIKSPFIYLGHLRRHNACPRAAAEGEIPQKGVNSFQV